MKYLIYGTTRKKLSELKDGEGLWHYFDFNAGDTPFTPELVKKIEERYNIDVLSFSRYDDPESVKKSTDGHKKKIKN